MTRQVFSRLFQVLAFSVLLLLASYVTLGRLAIGLVSYFQVEVEDQISKTLGVGFRTRSITGQWDILDPTIVLVGFSLGGAENAAISARRVELKLSSWRSLTEFFPVLSRVVVNAVSLQISKKEDGSWGISGIQGTRPQGLSDFTRLLSYADVLQISDLEVKIDTGQSIFLFTTAGSETGIEISADEDGGVFDAALQLANEATSGQRGPAAKMFLSGSFQGELSPISSASVSAFVSLENLRLATVYGSFREDNRTADAVLAGQAWLQLDKGGIASQVKLSVTDLSLTSKGSSVLSTEFAVSGDMADGTASVLVPEMSVIGSGEAIRIKGLSLAVEETSQGSFEVAAVLPSLRLDNRILPLLFDLQSEVGNQSQSSNRLSAMEPVALLSDLGLFVDSGSIKNSLRFVANVDDLQLRPEYGVPGLQGIKGFVSLGLESGFFDLQSGPSQIHFSTVYELPWQLDTSSGRLAYRIHDHGTQIFSGPLTVTSGELVARGKLLIDMQQEKLMRTWGLSVGLQDASLIGLEPFIPLTVPEETRNWISTAIRSGVAGKAGLVIHGSIDRSAAKVEKSYEIQFETMDAVLKYQPLWPEIAGLQGTVYISNRGVFAHGLKGEIFNTAVKDLSLRIHQGDDNPPEWVEISADLYGPFADLFKAFQETPLRDSISRAADNWTGHGFMKAGIEVSVGIGASAGAPPRIDTVVELADVQFDLTNIDLVIEDLSGLFRYQSDAGLTSEYFSCDLFDGPATGHIETNQLGQSGAFLVSLGGSSEVVQINKWLELPLFKFVQGSTDYQAILTLPYGGRDNRPMIEVSSQLVGINIDMPPPIGKITADTQREFKYQQVLGPDPLIASFSLEQSVTGNLKLMNGSVVGGRINLGEFRNEASAFDAIRVTGSLPFLSLSEWDLFFEKLEKKTDLSVQSEIRRHLKSIDVMVDRLNIYEFELENIAVKVTPLEEAWRVTLENDQILGEFVDFDDELEPLDVRLNYLRLASDPADAGLDPLSSVSSEMFVPFRFQSEQVVYDNEDYGSWSFLFSPSETGGDIKELNARVKGMEIDLPETFQWTNIPGQETTTFTGAIRVPELANTLEAWGYAAGLEGQGFNFQSRLKWLGSPLNVGIENLSGQLSIKGGKGRIVQVEANSSPLKLLGIFDFAEIAKRFRLDFTGLLAEGHSFNSVTGGVTMYDGSIDVTEPIVIVGAGSQFTLAGNLDLVSEKIDTDLIVTLPVNKNLPWYAAYTAFATGPITAAGVFLAQKIFKKQIRDMTSLKYEILGTLAEPEVKFVSMFDASVRALPEQSTEAQQ